MNKVVSLGIILAIALFSCKKDKETETGKEKEKTLESIAVTKQPDKKTYLVNETFDPAGMAVIAAYRDQPTAAVANSDLQFSYDFKTAGVNKTVTITYQGKTTEVNGITVTEPTPAVTLTDVVVKNVEWGKPAITMTPVGPIVWSPGSSAKADYTGAAVLTLTFSDGSSKDTTINNLTVSTVATLEKYYPFTTGLIFVEYPIENTPVSAVITAQTTTSATHTDTVYFNFASGDFFIVYSITNTLISAAVRGEQIPISFGNGTLEMTALEKMSIGGASQNGKQYYVYNIYPTLVFKHPENLEQEFPRHAYQLAEP